MQPNDVFELIAHADACRVPDALRGAGDAVARESAWYQAQIASAREPVYGATTLTGHLDAVRVPLDQARAAQRRILDSHCIGGPPFFPAATARLIGHAKAHAVAAGGSGLSPELYAHLLHALADPGFQPEIPAGDSYSCGDVIPAAHWARALLAHGRGDGRPELQPGDALALLNGSFVDLGSTLAVVVPLRDVLAAHLANGISLARGWPQPADMLRHAVVPDAARPLLQRVAQAGGGEAPPVQANVSIRATPQLLAALVPAASALVRVLGEELGKPSANPLVAAEDGRIDSQAGFMSLRLSLAKSGLAEAVLLAAWACQGRIEAVARRIESDPPPGVDGLDVVQVPKLAQAWLEGLRMALGRRLFASGSATSQGIEDLWSFGTLASAQLGHGIAAWARLEALLAWQLRLLDARTPGEAVGLLGLLRGGGPLAAADAVDPSLHASVTAALRDG